MLEAARTGCEKQTMLTEARHRALIRLLADQGEVSLEEAATRFRISFPTVRRDFQALAAAGHARRVHGAILTPDFALAEPRYSRKASQAVALKVRLASTVASLLPEAGTIFIDAGTTCLEVARAVSDRAQLRIFTNSVSVLALAPESRASLVSIGGDVRPVSLALTGGFAQSWVKALHFDASVVGASGIDRADGPCTTELTEASLKAEALRRARRRILVAHSAKWEKPAAVRYAPWDAFTDWVTDNPTPSDDRQRLARAGVKIHTLTSR
ncbi:MAG: DeoR/GlpR family DNA-binding transcription regulator [Opitutaceae bacterium]|nr:DeoR/GlpR family DNA-binding transcription regulator [Opitutaceae bacterium]